MTPRSLVGMTMGARKRAAQSVAVEQIEPLGITGVAQWIATWSTLRAAAGASLRIGQRLRPCPGEYQCKNCLQNNWCRCTDTEADAECVICGVLQHWPCDGSGVLPARAKKVRR